MCVFYRGHCVVHFCETNLKFGQVIKEDKLFKDISILALLSIFFNGAEPFVQLC